MVTVNITVTDEAVQPEIYLGRQGEKQAREIVFDLSALREKYGTGTATLYHQRSKDPAPYLIAETTGTTMTWTVSETDTVYAGIGYCEFRYTFGTEGLSKSTMFATNVKASLSGDVIIPAALQAWYDALIDYIDEHGGGSVDPEDIAAAVEDYMDEHPITESDPTVPTWAKASTKPTYTAAEVGAIAAPASASSGDVLTYSGGEWVAAAPSGGGGMSAAVKSALIQLAKKVIYADEGGQTYFETLRDALYTLNSITAVYESEVVIYTNTPLDSLKAGLSVTANYSDGYTEEISNDGYTLSGTLVAGTSTVTVSCRGLTTTFTVSVTQYRQPIHDWDFTQSLVDSIGGLEFVLTNSNGGTSLPTRDSTGLHFTAAEQVASTSGYVGRYADGRLYEFDVASAAFAGDTSKHKRLLNSGNDNLLIYRNAGELQICRGAWVKFTPESGKTIPKTLDELSGKTVGIKLGTDKTMYLYISGELIGSISNWTAASYEAGQFRFGGASSGKASDGNDIHNMTITGFRIYQDE